MHRCYCAILIAIFVASWTGSSCGASPDRTESAPVKGSKVLDHQRDVEQEKELLRLFADTLEQIKANYVDDKISERDLIDAAIRGMLAKLDPYSNYIPPKNLAQFRREIDQQYGGVGIRVEARDGQIVITSPLYGTPAHRAGLLPGDRILKIGAKSTKGMTLDAAVDCMKGKIGSRVQLTVRHPDAAIPTTVMLKREVIHLETVLGYRRQADDQWDFFCDPEKKIAYVRLTAFSKGAAKQLGDVLRTLLAKGMRGVILDLRFNPGGLLTEAIQVADLFVREGEITSTQGRHMPTRTWRATDRGTLIPKQFPVVVLVNRYSASASEIVSACLQDHHVALIVGERTWGKASVQNIIELEHGTSVLKLTTGGYHRPSGKNIHRRPGATPDEQWGVQPDDGHAFRLSNRELTQLVRSLHRWDVLGRKPETRPKSKFVDRQLQDALKYIRQRLHVDANPQDAQDVPAANPKKP